MAVNLTQVSNADPREFIAALSDERQRQESLVLLDLMREVTGEPPRMWGPSMIGFGHHHYKYASGREGDTFVIGFSPRSGKFALYGLLGHPSTDALLPQLGKYKRGAVCLYITKLSDVDRDVLHNLVTTALGRHA